MKYLSFILLYLVCASCSPSKVAITNAGLHEIDTINYKFDFSDSSFSFFPDSNFSENCVIIIEQPLFSLDLYDSLSPYGELAMLPIMNIIKGKKVCAKIVSHVSKRYNKTAEGSIYYSDKRAIAVFNFLILNGVARENLQHQGVGASYNKYTIEENLEQEYYNNRIEIFLSKCKTK